MMFYAFWELRNKPSLPYIKDIPHFEQVEQFFAQQEVQDVSAYPNALVERYTFHHAYSSATMDCLLWHS